jgi:hypothetical protein
MNDQTTATVAKPPNPNGEQLTVARGTPEEKRKEKRRGNRREKLHIYEFSIASFNLKSEEKKKLDL